MNNIGLAFLNKNSLKKIINPYKIKTLWKKRVTFADGTFYQKLSRIKTFNIRIKDEKEHCSRELENEYSS